MDFTPQQKYNLLSAMGYSGSPQAPEMDAFIQSNPRAASLLGKFTRVVKKRAESGYAKGGSTTTSRDRQDTYSKPSSTNSGRSSASNESGNSETRDRGFAEYTARKAESMATAPVAAPVAAPAAAPVAPAATTTPAAQDKSAGSKLTEAAIQQPGALTTKQDVAKVDVSPDTMIAAGTGQVTGANTVTPTTVTGVDQASGVTAKPAEMTSATTSAPAVAGVVDKTKAAVGTVDPNEMVTAAQGTVSQGALATAPEFDPANKKEVTAGTLNVTPDQLVTAAGQDAKAVQTQVAQAGSIEKVIAETGTVSANELPEAAQIKEADMAQATAITAEGLTKDAVAVAAKLEKFTVDNETLAQAMQGEVGPMDTVQGQLASLMKDFDDGTPAWAAGAIKAANAAMASRGLGGSSMAGAAILQAAMESALPIAKQDAETFSRMSLQNLDNRQKVSLANAAAQQGLQLQNLTNEQQAALQNSNNAFTLQTQNLSNMQSTVIANAQIKAALQGQNLSNQQQSNLAVAARYADVANANLNNKQQAALQNNLNSVNVELANLNAKQQAYVTNANLAASLQGQQITNQQQAAVANAARYADAAGITFTAEQQTAIHNSTLAQTIGLANLNSKQAATLQNAATVAQMDVTNLNNRQQAAVQNANAFLQMDMTNLSNQQQTDLFKAKANVDAILTDAAAENAARNINATSVNQTNQFYDGLASNIQQFNVNQTNAMKQFNAGEVNAVEKFNAQMESARSQFNAANSLVIAQANAQWRQNATTLDTSAQNAANAATALNMNSMTSQAMDELWQKERDILSYVFTSSESEKDRAVELMLGNKQLDAAAKAASDAEKGAMAALFVKVISGFL